METPRPISEVLPAVLADITARVVAQRQQDQENRQRRILDALRDFQRGDWLKRRRATSQMGAPTLFDVSVG